MLPDNKTPAANSDDFAPLIARIARHRDRDAFTALFDHFAPKLKSYCMSLQSQHTSAAMAEELVQEVMIKVWLKADSFDPGKASASTWIYTIARNCRIDYIRKANRHDTELSADDIWPVAESEEPYTSLQQLRVEKHVHQAVAELPEEQASVLRQIYMEGKSHSQVAELNNLPLGTVKSRVRLAVGKLRSLLREQALEA